MRSNSPRAAPAWGTNTGLPGAHSVSQHPYKPYSITMQSTAIMQQGSLGRMIPSEGPRYGRDGFAQACIQPSPCRVSGDLVQACRCLLPVWGPQTPATRQLTTRVVIQDKGGKMWRALPNSTLSYASGSWQRCCPVDLHVPWLFQHRVESGFDLGAHSRLKLVEMGRLG